MSKSTRIIKDVALIKPVMKNVFALIQWTGTDSDFHNDIYEDSWILMIAKGDIKNDKINLCGFIKSYRNLRSSYYSSSKRF